MIKQDFHIANLIAGYLSGTIAPEDKNRLDNWRKENPEHEALFQKVCNEKNVKRYIEKSLMFDTADGWSEVQKLIKKDNRRKRRMKIWGYAAAVLLPVFIAGLSLKETLSGKSQNLPVVIAQSIPPGEAKAVLTLENGEEISLSKETVGISQKLDAASIRIDSTTLSYRQALNVSKKVPLTYNSIRIPQGGEYTLVLSDGTKVYLNSMSSLRFPVAFRKGKREVELEGEAYFEVSKAGQPFTVNTRGMQVEVLGTAFNISAYPDEACRTTLVQGSVKVSAGEHAALVLKPSQQAVMAAEGHSLQVRTVDTSLYTSWVRGKIYFKDERLEDIMKSLSRWYDMKVVYEEENLKNIRFGCNLNRYEEIASFVKLLEKTEGVHARMSNKTITFYN